MAITQPAYDKTREHLRQFDTLPNVLVQDPARQCAYYSDHTELPRLLDEVLRN